MHSCKQKEGNTQREQTYQNEQANRNNKEHTRAHTNENKQTTLDANFGIYANNDTSGFDFTETVLKVFVHVMRNS